AAVALAIQGFRSRESALIEIGKTLNARVDVDELAARVVEVAQTVLQFEDCSVYLCDEQSDHLILKAAGALFTGRVGTVHYRIGEGITGWVAQHGESVRLESPTK